MENCKSKKNNVFFMEIFQSFFWYGLHLHLFERISLDPGSRSNDVSTFPLSDATEGCIHFLQEREAPIDGTKFEGLSGHCKKKVF